MKSILRSGGSDQLARIAWRAGVSLRHLERRFAHDVGLSPKTFARIMRLQRALGQIMAGRPISDVAVACGYFDQAHMTRDFSWLAETSPAAWRQHAGALAMLFVSYSLVFPLATVRDMPRSVLPSGAIHCSSIWRPARVDSQQPASHFRSWTVGTPCGSVAKAKSKPVIMPTA